MTKSIHVGAKIDEDAEKMLNALTAYLKMKFPNNRWTVSSTICGSIKILHNTLIKADETYKQCYDEVIE